MISGLNSAALTPCKKGRYPVEISALTPELNMTVRSLKFYSQTSRNPSPLFGFHELTPLEISCLFTTFILLKMNFERCGPDLAQVSRSLGSERATPKSERV